jgi:hypothetical protein
MNTTTPPGSYRHRRCHVCSKPYPLHLIKRCPVCHRPFCRRCGVVSSGRRFCSTACGRFDAFSEEPAGRPGRSS